VNTIDKKYSKYILLYIKVKIVKMSKYDLSCMRYCIVIVIVKCRVQLLNDLVILKDLK
jgi:hypothetical protein